MFLGIIYSIIAGLSMTLQGVFNTRLSTKIGLWETNTLVQGIAFLVTGIILFFNNTGQFSNIKSVNKLYLLGGVLGAIITFTVMKGIGSLGPTCSIAVILLIQLTSAAIVDGFGLFDSKVIKFTGNKLIGFIVMLAGIIIFKWKC